MSVNAVMVGGGKRGRVVVDGGRWVGWSGVEGKETSGMEGRVSLYKR